MEEEENKVEFEGGANTRLGAWSLIWEQHLSHFYNCVFEHKLAEKVLLGVPHVCRVHRPDRQPFFFEYKSPL